MIACRTWHNGTIAYVTEVKKKLPSGKFCDWGYGKIKDAVDLNTYWLKLFESDMKFVNGKYSLSNKE